MTRNEKTAQLKISDIYIREVNTLKKIVGGMGINYVDAQDILQDIFVQAVKKFKYYRNEDEARRWLIKVTVNRCRLEHRKRKTFHRKAIEVFERYEQNPNESVNGEKKAIKKEEVEILLSSLKDLDSAVLYPLIMKYYCEYNSTDIGKMLRLNPATVRSRLREGRMILAKQLMKRGVKP
ncbi:MAG: hypothetical protein DRP56_06285 [Planctomycetota bacterium]|nr:MAG: hypothetical protein DRP56_06285 [Planctomycetota bacterium]